MNPDCSRIAASGARQARYTPGELEELLAGTTVRGRIARGLARGAERAGALKAGIEWAWHAGQAPRLTLPRDSDRVLIGRTSAR